MTNRIFEILSTLCLVVGLHVISLLNDSSSNGAHISEINDGILSSRAKSTIEREETSQQYTKNTFLTSMPCVPKD